MTSKSQFLKDKKRLLKMEKPNIEVNISNVKFKVDANPDVYSEDDLEKLGKTVDLLSKSIWIDRTYVDFKGNRFKDAFIKEDKWYDLVKLILKTDIGRTGTKRQNDFIIGSLMAVALTYIYEILEKLGYDMDNIDLDIRKSKFKVEYFIDDRKTWNS